MYRIKSKYLTSWLFLMPVLSCIVFVIVVPLGYLFYFIFTNEENHFIGLQNLIRFSQDSTTLASLWITLKFVLISVPIQLGIGMLIALLLDNLSPRVKKVALVSLIVPMVIPYVVSGLIWSLLFSRMFGVVNYFLGFVRIGPVSWLSDPSVVMYSIVIISSWMWMPFVVIVLYSGIQAVPGQLREAADLDGASSWRVFRHIILPFLKPFFVIAAFVRVSDAFKTFDEVFVSTEGGPRYASELMSIRIYKIGMKQVQLHYASVLALFLFILVLLCSIGIIRALWKE